MPKDCSVRSWLASIEPSNALTGSSLSIGQDPVPPLQPGKSKRKRPHYQEEIIEQTSKILRPQNRRSKRLHTLRGDISRTLAESSGNIMAPFKTSKEERARQKTPQRSSRGRRQGGAPRADGLTAECEEPEEDMTPRPHRKGSGPLSNERIPDLRPTSDSCSIASDASSAASRAQSPVKTLADLRMAERPTYMHDLDGNEAEAAGGVLSRYRRLMEISRGIRVIPYHLKVNLPIDDPKLSMTTLTLSLTQGFVEKELHVADWPSDSAYTSPEDTLDEVERTYQQDWGDRANHFRTQAAECTRESLTEANWNARVHDPLLALIVEDPKFKDSIGYMNVLVTQKNT